MQEKTASVICMKTGNVLLSPDKQARKIRAPSEGGSKNQTSFYMIPQTDSVTTGSQCIRKLTDDKRTS